MSKKPFKWFSALCPATIERYNLSMPDWCVELDRAFREMDAERRFGPKEPSPMDPIVEKVRQDITSAFAGATKSPAKLKRNSTMRSQKDREVALECLRLAVNGKDLAPDRDVMSKAERYFAFVTGEPEKSVRQQINDLLDASEVK